MNWNEVVDAYCERVAPGFWAEPVNAATNLAFLIAAAVMFRRLKGQDLPLANGMVAVLAVIGVGSFLFHTFATTWASATDVVPILLFILLYLFAANRDFWHLRLWPALGVTALFLPYAWVTVPFFDWVGFLGSSAAYGPVPLLILIYAVMLRKHAPETAFGLAIGAGILVVSLAFRTLDEPVCSSFPLGTHFLWHLVNAVMLGWMIEVYRRHMTRI